MKQNATWAGVALAFIALAQQALSLYAESVKQHRAADVLYGQLETATAALSATSDGDCQPGH